ncbi:MAG: DNA polymerase IV [Prevotellaceae bacterium]|jgi:DNA polymerase-4|nr:DNA polymerase IV [Prevotellaceae bacterium]
MKTEQQYRTDPEIRKIIHIDMDAFYASVEQRDNEEYRGKPVAVGSPEARGVVSAASYEARAYGIHSAMPSVTAKKKCPHLIFVLPRFDVYQAVSLQIRDIFLEYTDLVEPLSLDEAFLDVTVNHKNIPSAIFIATEIQRRIYEETGLRASAGVSCNKFLAKIASDYKKPNGFFVILPQNAEKFIESLKIEQFYGVGKVTAQKMHEHGIFTGLDLKKRSDAELVGLFGKAGHIFYEYARGIDLRKVEPDRITKSVSSETTFTSDKDSLLLLNVELYNLAREVIQRMKDEPFYGKTVTVKVKYSDFRIITRSRTFAHTITDFYSLWNAGKEILKQVDLSQKKIRLLGLCVSNAGNETEQKYIQPELDLI